MSLAAHWQGGGGANGEQAASPSAAPAPTCLALCLLYLSRTLHCDGDAIPKGQRITIWHRWLGGFRQGGAARPAEQSTRDWREGGGARERAAGHGRTHPRWAAAAAARSFAATLPSSG